MSRRQRRSLSAEFKANAVDLLRRSGKGVGQVAKELDLTETSRREWVKQAEEKLRAGKRFKAPPVKPLGRIVPAERG